MDKARHWPPALYDEFGSEFIKRYGLEDGSRGCSTCGAPGTSVTPLLPNGEHEAVCMDCHDFSASANHFFRRIEHRRPKRTKRDYLANAMLLGEICASALLRLGDEDDGLGRIHSAERRKSVQRRRKLEIVPCYRGSFESVMHVRGDGREDSGAVRIDWLIDCGEDGSLVDNPVADCFVVRGEGCPDSLAGSVKIGMFRSTAQELIETGFIEGSGKAMVADSNPPLWVSFELIEAPAARKKAA